MTLLDANIVLYAYNSDAPQHRVAAKWLVDLFSSGEAVALPWVTLWAFIRISTNPRLWTTPLSGKGAFAIVRELISEPGVILLQAGPRHLDLLEKLVTTYGAGGIKTTDAVLAALAIEYGAVLASADLDFSRFKELQWVNPLTK